MNQSVDEPRSNQISSLPLEPSDTSQYSAADFCNHGIVDGSVEWANKNEIYRKSRNIPELTAI